MLTILPPLPFAPDVMQLLKRRRIRDQIRRVKSEIVTGISIHGDYMEKSQMELCIYDNDADIFAEVYVDGPPRLPPLWYPQSLFENLAAGFPIKLRCFSDWGLR